MKFVKLNSDCMKEVLKFVRMNGDFSREVLKFVKLSIVKRQWFMTLGGGG